MSTIGDDVVALLEGARKDVLIVAPFVKVDALTRLLGCVGGGVKKKVVTRWRLAEILAGVADLGVLNVAETANAELYLCRNLHGKLYAADDVCLVGSANVTRTALGWRSPANVELLVATHRSDPHVFDFEKRLEAQMTLATRDHHDSLQTAVDEIGEGSGKIAFNEGEPSLALLPASWIPEARNPEDLYSVYAGTVDVSFGLFRSLKEELSKFGIVEGLSQGAFDAWIADAISQTPLVQTVLGALDGGSAITEEGLARILEERDLTDRVEDVAYLLEVLRRWLNMFFSDRYQMTSDTVKLISAKRV